MRNRTECGGGRHRRAFGGCNDEAKQWSRKVRRREAGQAIAAQLDAEEAESRESWLSVRSTQTETGGAEVN